MASAWTIGPLNLPIAPTTVRRRVMRKQEAKSIMFDFPIPMDMGPDMYELELTGYIWPSSKAYALWELTKNADEPSIQILVDEAQEPNFALYNGRYATSKSEIWAEGGLHIADAGFVGGEGPVHQYTITFIQFAEQSVTSDSDIIDPETDEDGIGWDIPDGTTDFFDFDRFFNVLEKVFSI